MFSFHITVLCIIGDWINDRILHFYNKQSTQSHRDPTPKRSTEASVNARGANGQLR